jgi:23S rRNA (adenine2503-C2)-methyltransferase
MTDLYSLLPTEVDDLVTSLGASRYRADQLLRALYRGAPASLADIPNLPKDLRARLAESGYRIGFPPEIRRVTSEDGETTKLLLRLSDGVLVETVLMQYPEEARHPRSTVCVSTQAGCAMGCVFCATGQMGFERNLSAAEIVAQVLHFSRILAAAGQHVTNIVFMGMGEPLANYGETVRAVRLLTEPRAFGLGQRHVTISTVGIVSAIDRLAAEGLQVGLAISLHAPSNELRRELVPTAGPASVDALVAAANRYFQATGRRVTFEYALIHGRNDSPAVAAELAALLRGTHIHVNLIPLNPTAGDFRRPSRTAVLQFQRVLAEAGVNCTVRVEKGSEISAACGQLRTDEDRKLAGTASAALAE